jgi:hypothetical protein
VDPVVAAERRGGVEERRLGATEAVQQQDIGALAHGQSRDAVAALLDVVDTQQRRAAVGEAEHALEADGEVEIAASGEAPLRERLDARDVPRRSASQVWASVPMTTSGRRPVMPERTRAPWVVHRTSHVLPTSPSRRW